MASETPTDRTLPRLSLTRVALWTAVFVGVLFAASRGVHALRRQVWFDCPPHWPCSIFNPRAPQGLVEWAAVALTAGLGAAMIVLLRRRGYSLLPVTVTGCALILLSNAIQGVPKGFYNPIAGGRAPEQYYHDSRHVHSARAFLENFAEIQPTLHTHARTHPPGAVLLFYGLRRGFGDDPSAMAVLIALFSTLVSAPALYRLARQVLGADRSFAGYATLLYLMLPAVQIYYCATLDAAIAALLLAAIALWCEEPLGWRSALGAACVLAASFLTFGFVWVLPVLLAIDWLRRRWWGVFWAVAPLALFYGALRLVTGFDYLLAGRTASHLENPRGFRLLVEPLSYGMTRIEDVSELLVFLGPVLIGLLAWGLPILRAAPAANRTTAVFWTGTLTLAALFLTGAFHTGETARACLFLYPLLVLPPLAALQRMSDYERILALAFVFAQAVGMQTFANFFW